MRAEIFTMVFIRSIRCLNILLCFLSIMYPIMAFKIVLEGKEEGRKKTDACLQKLYISFGITFSLPTDTKNHLIG